MKYKYTELVLFKDGRVSVKEKRVCVKLIHFNIKVYWAQRPDSWFYAPQGYLCPGAFEINVCNLHLHTRGLASILEVDSAFASLEPLK